MKISNSIVSYHLMLGFIILSAIASSAQTQKEYEAEIQKLKNELTASNERAMIAESNARNLQKMAHASADEARKAMERAVRARYIAQAKVMALKSKELTDPVQAALVAQLAYKFNVRYNGKLTDVDICKALSSALTRLNDHSKQNPSDLSAMSKSLCALLKRDMTKEEWTEFVGDDLMYEKACDQ